MQNLKRRNETNNPDLRVDTVEICPDGVTMRRSWDNVQTTKPTTVRTSNPQSGM